MDDLQSIKMRAGGACGQMSFLSILCTAHNQILSTRQTLTMQWTIFKKSQQDTGDNDVILHNLMSFAGRTLLATADGSMFH